MSYQFPVPTPLIPWVPLITNAARDILKIAGAGGLTWAQTVSDSDLTRAISASLLAVGMAWGYWQKWQTSKALSKAAAAPAGTPAPTTPA